MAFSAIGTRSSGICHGVVGKLVYFLLSMNYLNEVAKFLSLKGDALKRYQRGFLRKEKRARGEVWVYRFRQTRHSDGKRVERNKVVGPVATIGKSEGAAWKEVERLHLQQLVNEPEQATAPTFREL